MNQSGNRGVLLITAGSVIGQLFTLLSTPILSRIFTPQEMGYVTIFSALAGLVTTTAAFHYELAIPLPKSERTAQVISRASIALSMATAIIASLLLWISGPELLAYAEAADLVSVQYLLPVSIFLGSLCTIATFGAVRAQRHGANAIAKAIQGGTQTAVQVCGALLGSSWKILLAGQLAGLIAGTFALSRYLPTLPKNLANQRNFFRTRRVLSHYRNFPLAAAPSSLVNAAATNIPALLLATLFGANIAGFYGLGLRVLQLPMRFIGQAISQVLFGQAANALRANKLPELVERVFVALLKFSLHTFIPLSIIAQPLFRFAFGNDWGMAGTYTQWLSPWLLAGFISSPLSILVTVLQRQKQELVLQLLYLILISIALLSGYLFQNVFVSLSALSALGGGFLLIKVVWILKISGCNLGNLAHTCFAELIRIVPIHATLLLLTFGSLSASHIALIGLLWIALIHGINYRWRGIYAF